MTSEPADLPADRDPPADDRASSEPAGPDLHELVNLVNGVLVQAQLLSRRLDSEVVADKTRESIAAVNSECRRLLEFLRAGRR